MVESAVSIVTVIFIMIAVGFVFHRKRWLSDNAETVLSRVTLRIGMPALVLTNILTNYSRDMLIQGAPMLLIPLCVMTVCYFIAIRLARFLRVPEWRHGVYIGLFTFGNTVFLGMPVAIAIFGDHVTPSILLYYLVNTLFWWFIGAQRVARDGGARVASPLKRMATPPLVTTIIALILLMFSLRLPAPIMRAADYLGKIVTPLSMLFIGYMLSSMLSHGLRWQKGYGSVLLGRFVLAPMLCLLLCLLFNVPKEIMGVFFVLSGMPSQTQTCLWAQEQGADAQYAAGAVALSTLVGLAAIPAYVWVLGLL